LLEPWIKTEGPSCSLLIFLKGWLLL
jgi:hypothetical protein